LGEILEALLLRLTLAIGARHLEARRPETALICVALVENRRQLPHATILPDRAPVSRRASVEGTRDPVAVARWRAMSALVRAFQKAAGGARGSAHPTGDLAALLGALYARGRAAHPRLAVGEEAFGRCLGRCADETPVPELDKLAAEDLYLACACVEGVRGAADAFEAAHAKAIRRAVSRVTVTPHDRDEAEQRVRQHLLLGERAAGPALAKYPGRITLARWIPVVALRIAISMNRSESVERRLREKAGAEAMGVSPENLYMKAELRQVLEPAVEEALAKLSDRDRMILRFYLIAGMKVRAIGATFGMSHQAVSKRLAAAREAMVAHVRHTVATRLKIPKDELSSIMRFVVSQLDVNISRILRAESADR